MRTDKTWLAILIAMFAITTTIAATDSFGQSLPGNVWVVDQDAGDDGNTGQDEWENAFETLQKALSVVSPGEQIWVASSSTPYTPSAQVDPNELTQIASAYGPDVEARMATFRLIKNVGIYGGFLGNAHPSGGETSLSEADPENNITILSGDLNGDDDQDEFDDNAYHVLLYYQDSDDNSPPNPAQLIVDGFVITGGIADGGDVSSSFGALNALGGGALVVYEAHFEFLGENADPDFAKALAPVFSRCVFDTNLAELGGGAIAGVYNGGRAIDCTFISNAQFATSGTSYSGKFTRGGGAMSVLGPVAILKSTFIENESVALGGAVHHNGVPGHEPDGGTYLISNCTFQKNTAPNGGGVSTLPGPVVNSLFVGNSAEAFGGVRDSHLLNDGDWQVSEACDEEELSGGDESIANHLEGTDIGDLLDHSWKKKTKKPQRNSQQSCWSC